MIRKCELRNIPDSLHGETYSIFSFEVFDGTPHTLYIGNEFGDMIAITGLNELVAYRSKILPYKTTFFDYPINYRYCRTKKDLFEAMKQKYEARIEDLTKEYAAKSFESFLRSITIIDSGKSALPIKPDVRFAESYYGIKMKVLEKGDGKTATVTMSCDNTAINTSVAETIDILKAINNAEDEA